MSSSDKFVTTNARKTARPFTYEEARESTPAAREGYLKPKDYGSWGIGVVKNLFTSPFCSTKNSLQKRQGTAGQIATNFNRD